MYKRLCSIQKLTNIFELPKVRYACLAPKCIDIIATCSKISIKINLKKLLLIFLMPQSFNI